MVDHALRLHSEAFPADQLQVARLDGEERIGVPFSFDLVVAAESDPIDPVQMRGADVAIVWELDGIESHRVWGMVAEVTDLLSSNLRFRSYRLRVVPRAHRLALVEMQDIFLEHSVPEVVEEKLRRVGLADTCDLHLLRDYPKREFILQYEETDLAFISRLVEHLGISMLFVHDDSDRIVFVDEAGGFPELDEPIPYFEQGEGHGVFALERTLAVTPGQYVVQDYNYRNPTVELTGTGPVDEGYGGGVVEYGSHHKDTTAAKALAELRAEEVRTRQDVYRGRCSDHRLAAGTRFVVEGHSVLGDVPLLVTEVTHRCRVPIMGSAAEVDGEHSYENHFVAIPADRPYRPPRRTPKPKMHGVYVALVQPTAEDLVGASAQLDDEGRYRVRFLFDSGPREGPTSRPIRMVQPHSGVGHGMHFPLRPGVEVAVGFANGDPDRPLILGALDNPSTKSPTTAKNSRANIVSTATGIVLTLHDSE